MLKSRPVLGFAGLLKTYNEAVKNGWEISSFLYGQGAPLSGWAKDMLADIPTACNYQLAPGLMAELSGKEDPRSCWLW